MPSPPPVPSPGSLSARTWNAITRLHVASYRRSGGRVGGRWGKAPVLLLDHVGRRTGIPRTTPLLYLPDGENLVIVGSRGGSKAPPAWWLNLEDEPRTTVQVGPRRREVVARTASAQEKQRLWLRLVDMYSDFETYERRTDRDIPVVILEPARAGAA
jgi:F420H(2)-dependent quinone reductase